MDISRAQAEALKNAGYAELAEDPNCIITRLLNSAEYLYSHNKNYTKKQYCEVVELYDILTALYNAE